MQLLREEDKYIMQHREDPKCLNILRALLTEEYKHQYNVTKSKEYRNEHLEDIRSYDRERNIERNNDKVKCACGVEYPRYQKSVHDKSRRHMEYLIEFVDKKLSLCELGTVTCECGSIVTKKGFINHKKTKKHNELLKEKCDNK